MSIYIVNKNSTNLIIWASSTRVKLTNVNAEELKRYLRCFTIHAEQSHVENHVGTVQFAMRLFGKCKTFTGIDISTKTIERAKENLNAFQNINLLSGDLLTCLFNENFDVIYYSLTFMHIKEKKTAIQKGLLY